MGRKIMSIASIIFALTFIIIFILVWNGSKNVFKAQANAMNSMYSTEVPFDYALFNNRVVTGRTLNNLATDLGKNAYTGSLKLSFYDEYDNLLVSPSDYANKNEVTEFNEKSEYYVSYHYNDNDAIDGIVTNLIPNT